MQSELQDGRASLALEYYLGRNETPVLDESGNHVLYTEGAMKGKPKYKIKHIRKREVLNLYIWLNPRNQQECFRRHWENELYADKTPKYTNQLRH